MRKCKVDDCEREFYAKGYCEKHLRNFNLNGNPVSRRESTKTIFHTNKKEYFIWAGMKNRCTNVKNKDYKYYGAKGVKVCDRWMESSYEFFKDMGKCEEGLTIDRIDTEGNYEPSNCRWVSMEVQNRNKRKK